MIGKHYVSISGRRLDCYSHGFGGGMSGGYCRQTVRRCASDSVEGAGRAEIVIEKAEWHNQDPEIRRYLTDAAVMDELEKIIRRYRMNFWNRKKFTDMFICDGENEDYCFDFERATVSFSSQFYPPVYRDKLRKLNDVVEEYMRRSDDGSVKNEV